MDAPLRRALTAIPAPPLYRLCVLALVAVFGCGDRKDEPRTDEPSFSSMPALTGARVVLVTIDGVRWQDVFRGLAPGEGGALPRTRALVALRGLAIGGDIPGCDTMHTASGSNVSLPGYIEIFTGHPSRCLDNDCSAVRSSVLDEAARAGVPGVASIGAWPTLRRAVSGGAPGVFVAEGRAWPSDTSARLAPLVAAGEHADPMPGTGDYRPDAATAAIALGYLRDAKPAFLHIGLGDTDEWAHRADYPAYFAALQHADAMIGDLADTLDAMGDEGRATTVLVTTDHGRAASFVDHSMLRPESGRTFLLAFGGHVPKRGVTCAGRDVTLADVAPTVRVLLGLPEDRAAGAGRPLEIITDEGE